MCAIEGRNFLSRYPTPPYSVFRTVPKFSVGSQHYYQTPSLAHMFDPIIAFTLRAIVPKGGLS